MEAESINISINATDNASSVINGVAGALGGLTGSGNGAGKSVKGSITDIGEAAGRITKPISIAAAAVGGLEVASAKAAIAFEDNFAAVRKTVDGSAEQIDGIKQSIIDMTTVGINGHGAIPMTTAQLIELAAAGGQLGIATENIPKFTETMAQLQTATNLGGEQGAQTLAQFMNVANVSQDKVSNLGSSIVDLGNHFATTEAQIADMAMNMGATGTVVRISAQDILAYSTALSSLGVDAAAGGSSVSRIWMDMQSAVSAGGEGLNQFAKISGKTSEEFAKQWKTDASGAFRDFLSGLNKSEDQVGVLSDLGFNNIRDIQALQRLAGDKGFALLTDAIKRSNQAWEENTALQTEFDEKQKTTASQMQIAKNNIVEAGRSLGETMLPAIASASTKVANVAKGFSQMSDTGKSAVVTGATLFTGVGLGAKAATSAIVGVGKFLDAKDKITEYAEAGSKLAGVFTAVGSAAVPVAVGIAGITAAVGVGKVAYDAWYNSQYKWGESLVEPTEKVKSSIEAMNELNALQKDYNATSKSISSGELEGEELEQAKQHLQEIISQLNEKYNLDIDCNLDELEQANKLVNDTIDKTKQQTYNEFKTNMSDLRFQLSKDKGQYQESKQTYQDNASYYDYEEKRASAAQNAYAKLKNIYDDYQISKKNGGYTQEQETKAIKEANEAIKEYNKNVSDSEKLREVNSFDGSKMGDEGIIDRLQSLTTTQKEAEKAAEYYKGIMDDLNTSMQEYEAAQSEWVNGSLSEYMHGLETGNVSEQAEAMRYLAEAVQSYGASATDTAQKLTSLQTGFNDINSAMQGNDLTGYLNTFVSDMQSFGQNADQITDGISDLFSGLDFSKVDASGIEQINTALSNLKGMEGVKIQVDASGNISVLDEATNKITELKSQSGVNVSVNADGELTVLDEASGKLQTLQGTGPVTLEINADDSNITDVLNKAGELVAQVDNTTGEIKIEGEDNTSEAVESAKSNIESIEPKLVKIEAEDNTGPGVQSAKANINSVEDKTVTITVNYVTNGTPPIQKARGTSNFEGGLAMVNDERGISDPRELIIDNGRMFIPEGKDVILPLHKGAQIFTASETKRIMAGMGIPKFAGGSGSVIPENSDAFKLANFKWSHIMNSRAVTVTEELQHWNEEITKFKGNIKDTYDIEEAIFKAMQKLRKEQNEDSEAYIFDRVEMNDWQTWEDSAIDAFNRVREREQKYVDDMIITQREANAYIVKLGEDMYESRKEESLAWLNHEEKYNDMRVEDYIAGLERMKVYTDEYYANGLITAKKYYTSMQKIDDEIIDKRKEGYKKEYSDWQKDAEQYKKRAETYGWGNDTEINYWDRYIKRIRNFYADGKISFDEYVYDIQNAQMEMYKTQGSIYDSMLEQAKAYVDGVEKQFAAEKEAYEDRWDMYKLNKNIKEQQDRIKLYSGAVTARGKDALKDAQGKLEDYLHEKGSIELEKRQSEQLESFRRDYSRLETSKKYAISAINGSVAGLGDFIKNIKKMPDNVTLLLGDILTAIKNVEFKGNTYGDTSYTVNLPTIEGPFKIADFARALGGY